MTAAGRRAAARLAALSVLLLAGAALAAQEPGTPTAGASSHAPGQDAVLADGVFFEKTAIIGFTNNSGSPVHSFTLWLGAGHSFEEFKTEKGWIGKRSPEGTITFTASEPLQAGGSVKLGVKTDGPNPGINWMAADAAGNAVRVGKTSTGAAAGPSPGPGAGAPAGVLEGSTFRIIPEKPNVGSTIRVVGEGFAASHQFSFYIDARNLGTFLSDGDGNFITTMKVPDGQKADRVNFRVVDADGGERSVSLRLGEVKTRVPDADDVKLTIDRIPSTLHRGDVLEMSGTAQPNSAITASVRDAAGNIINTRTAEVDAKGTWSLPEPISIPLDTAFGKYNVEISDGRESILRTWEIQSSKVIVITPASLRFEPGDLIRYSGTAQPNQAIELVLEDPLGIEIDSVITNTDGSGAVGFEYQTDRNSKEGTYRLTAKQGEHREFVFVGLGQLPEIPIYFEFDKLNYKSFETATIYLTGSASELVSLLIIDPSDKPKGEAVSITLAPDGTAKHVLDLGGYKSGVYTAVISKGTAQSKATFTVGLEIGAGNISVLTTKADYAPGDSLLILGETEVPNTLLTLDLMDPDGDTVKTTDTFSDKNGRISESSFRIPSEAKLGAWTLKATSGPNFDTVQINVASTREGIVVSVEDRDGGNGILIQVIGASPSQTVKIEILSPDGQVVAKLEPRSTKTGEIHLPWTIPEGTEPGTYTIKASDARSESQAAHEFR